MEGLKHTYIRERFTFPNIKSELGEFDRVADTFGLESDVLVFLAKTEGKMVVLDDAMWVHLHNTDSINITKGDWETVDANVQEGNKSADKPRDWKFLKHKIESGIKLDASIIMKYGDLYHVVSGNTRLMVSKALGINPEVLIFEYRESI